MYEELIEIICNYVEVNKADITVDSRFIEDLGFNSYDFMSMIGEVEDTYDVEVEEREVSNIRTVGEAAAYIKTLSEE